MGFDGRVWVIERRHLTAQGGGWDEWRPCGEPVTCSSRATVEQRVKGMIGDGPWAYRVVEYRRSETKANARRKG